MNKFLMLSFFSHVLNNNSKGYEILQLYWTIFFYQEYFRNLNPPDIKKYNNTLEGGVDQSR